METKKIKIKLTEKEEEVYQKIIKDGTMEDMFELAYAIGRERLAAEQIELFSKHF